jgi:5'-nucleotidase
VRILVTNDDGIDSEGLHVLARAMGAHGAVTVVAPDDEYSGASAALGALNRIQPEVHQVRLEGLPDAWAVTGPPALCVMFARLGAFGPPFDLVVAGINPGVNVGRSVYHSGTVGAALTARAGGISGVAVSQAVQDYGVEGQGWDEMLAGQKWDAAGAVASAVVGGLPTGADGPVVVNLNIPNLPIAEMAGWQYTSVGRVPPRTMAEARLEPKVGHSGTFRVEMKWGDAVSLPDGTDGGAVERGQVSVTLVSALADSRTPGRGPAEDSAEVAIGGALDRLFGRP